LPAIILANGYQFWYIYGKEYNDNLY
jgi:hypothetical protein